MTDYDPLVQAAIDRLVSAMEGMGRRGRGSFAAAAAGVEAAVSADSPFPALMRALDGLAQALDAVDPTPVDPDDDQRQAIVEHLENMLIAASDDPTATQRYLATIHEYDLNLIDDKHDASRLRLLFVNRWFSISRASFEPGAEIDARMEDDG